MGAWKKSRRTKKSYKKGRSHDGSMEEVKENKKVLYNFAIVNELLIIKNRRISLAYWLMRRNAAALPTRLLGAREVVCYKRLRTNGA